MKLVKIGDQWINMDHVIHIADRGSVIRVYFAGAIEGQTPHSLEFQDASDVQALREWLRHNDEDIDPVRRSARTH
jgi:hypothetical protein